MRKEMSSGREEGFLHSPDLLMTWAWDLGIGSIYRLLHFFIKAATTCSPLTYFLVTASADRNP